MKRFVTLLVSLLTVLTVFSQNGYNITLKIPGARYPSLLLTTYYGNKVKLVDTAYAKKQGTFIFKGDNKLDGGIYMAVSPEKVKLFEFIVNNNQKFTLQTDTAGYVMHMTVGGSMENRIFFDYLKFNNGIYQQVKAVKSLMRKDDAKSSSFKKLQQEMDFLNEVSADYKLRIIKKYPEMFVSRLFDAMREVKEPKIHPKSDSLFGYHFVKHHFWDHFPLNDPRLLHTPLYSRKINTYFKRLVPFDPDSVNASIDKVIAMAWPSKECVSYLVWHFTVEYQNPKYMGFDKVFVHMVDNYFAKEPIINTTQSIKKLLMDRADKIRPLLIGKPAPDLILMDTSGQYIDFRAVKHRFTLLFFWDYNCHICKRQLAEFVPMYAGLQKKYDMEVYGININTNLDRWKEAVRNRHLPGVNVNGTRSIKGNFNKLYDIHGTPQLYLLNEKKEIIAKQFSVNQLRLILDSYKNKFLSH